MLFVTTYQFKGPQTPEANEALLKRFGEVARPSGEIAHYLFADGSGGVVVAEEDDVKAIHGASLAFAEWLSFDTKLALTIDDAMPGILENLQR